MRKGEVDVSILVKYKNPSASVLHDPQPHLPKAWWAQVQHLLGEEMDSLILQ